MPDIHTTKGREKLRRQLKGYAFMGDYIRALDGLDIAQEMARATRAMDTTITTKRLGSIYESSRALWDWYRITSERMVELLAEWDNWQGGTKEKPE